MITEDDKKAAYDYVMRESGLFAEPYRCFNPSDMLEVFLAGVAHARQSLRPADWPKPHIVADNPTIPDVPPFESIHKEYLVYTTFGDFGIYTRREQTESSKAQWVTENGERFFSDHIKYWWPLPEVEI